MEPDPSKQLELLYGGQDVKAIDISGSLPRHPSGKAYQTRDLSKVNKIVVHCTDRNWTLVKLAMYDITPYFVVDGKKIYNHIDKTGLPAITYHDIVMNNGKLYHTLGYEEISMHAGGYNTGSIAVALMYIVTDPATGKDTFAPSELAIKTLQRHLGKLCLQLGLTPDRIFGHRELMGTGWFLSASGSKRLRKTCPGMQVDLDLLRTRAAKYMQLVLLVHGYYKGRIDGDFGPKSRAALALFKKG